MKVRTRKQTNPPPPTSQVLFCLYLLCRNKSHSSSLIPTWTDTRRLFWAVMRPNLDWPLSLGFFSEAVSAGWGWNDAKGEDNIVLKINFWCWWVNWKLPKEKGQAGSPAHPKRLINDHYKINKMGFGRQQRLNAVDTDKYSHFGEKCTFIGTKCQGLKKLPTAVRAGHFILVVIC